MWNFLSNLAGGGISALGSIYGAEVNSDAQKQINAQNIAEQEKFAQNAVQWKVADAKAAGINPLAALGAPVNSFSNVVAPQPGAGFAQAGQALGRAVAAMQSPEDRAAAAANTALDLQNKQLNNEFIQSKINQMNAPGLAPGVPPFNTRTDIAVRPGPVEVAPDKVTASDPSGGAAGIHPDYQLSNVPGGGLAVSPPHDLAALGFFHPASLSWWARHGIAPIWNDDMRPPEGRGKGYNPFTMTYWPSPGVFRYGGSNTSGAPSTFGAP